jgi:hypothetical protein
MLLVSLMNPRRLEIPTPKIMLRIGSLYQSEAEDETSTGDDKKDCEPLEAFESQFPASQEFDVDTDTDVKEDAVDVVADERVAEAFEFSGAVAPDAFGVADESSPLGDSEIPIPKITLRIRSLIKAKQTTRHPLVTTNEGCASNAHSNTSTHRNSPLQRP